MHLIEQIGSYAGLAAIPGLAVLAALYFSQARDVRRLREWAGRAPERAAEQATGGRVAGQAQQPGAGPVAAATPAAVAPAAAAGAAKPAAAATGAAAAAGTATAAKTATPGKASTPAGAAAAGAGAAGGSATGTVARPGPPAVGGVRPGAPAVRRPIPRVPSSQTSILTPTSEQRDPWYRRAANRLPAGRYIALVVAGILVLGGGAAYALTQLGDSGSSGTSTPASNTSTKAPNGGSKKSGSSSPSISPSSVTVTVVNGTSTPNLARDTASKLTALGFVKGNTVTGTGSLAAAESIVEYKPGAEAEARLVADKLHINQKQPADGDALAQAGPANVIVVLGADQAPGG